MHKDNVIQFPLFDGDGFEIENPETWTWFSNKSNQEIVDDIAEQSIEVAEQAMELEKQSQQLLSQALKILEAMQALEIDDDN